MTDGYRIEEEHLRSAEEDDDAAAARARLEQQLADQEVVAILAEQQFAGRAWDEGLAPDLAHYGISVLRVWIATGMIFTHCRERNLQLAPWIQPPSREEINDLARMTVAYALKTFRQRALIGKGWDVAGGASLASWFIGCCIFAFPNLWRERNRSHERELKFEAAMRTAVESAIRTGVLKQEAPDPATVVAVREQAQQALAELGEDERRIVALMAEGYSRDEIAELLGIGVRAMEGRLYRSRKARSKSKGEESDAPSR